MGSFCVFLGVSSALMVKLSSVIIALEKLGIESGRRFGLN